MEPKYIVAIVALGLFAFLFLVYFMLLARKKRADAKLQAYLSELYSDTSLIKPDYDNNDYYDNNSIFEAELDESEEGVPSTAIALIEEKSSTESVKKEPENVPAKKEIEGIEEITGNYIPE